MSDSFIDSAGDGLCGLAWDNINTVKPDPVKTPVDNMCTQCQLGHDNQLFTFYAGSWRDVNDPDHGETFYTFGCTVCWPLRLTPRWRMSMLTMERTGYERGQSLRRHDQLDACRQLSRLLGVQLRVVGSQRRLDCPNRQQGHRRYWYYSWPGGRQDRKRNLRRDTGLAIYCPTAGLVLPNQHSPQ